MTWTVGVETGGTFTDLLMIGPEGQIVLEKTLSTPHAPEDAVMTALARGLEKAGIAAGRVGRLLHGSTLAANALIERDAPLPALITKRGFRDLLLIQRQDKSRIHDMFYRKPRPLIDRDRIYEVTERLAADGSVVTPLDRADVLDVVARIVGETGARTIAVCLLHSYANPAHERTIAAWIAERHPSIAVTLSSDVCPVHREYERLGTPVTSAYLRPVVATYLARVEARVAEAGFPSAPLIMQSNGGVLPVDAVCRRPAGMYLSGPAAAVKGAQHLAANGRPRSLITLDVGGTSCDICLISDGEAAEAGHGGVQDTAHGLPLDLVRTDIVTIGAGGGSIAWLDAGGMLCVGPRSAGADPGPACYGRGGTGFTLTDAMVVLGLLPEGGAGGGGLTLSRAPAQAAAAVLASAMKTDVLGVARAVSRVAVANIARAVRGVTVQRGFHPRDYALFACGGAGPLLAVSVAEEMGIDHVVVPPHPGVFSAFGLIVAGLRMDYVADTGGWSTERLAAEEVGGCSRP
jgi:N-methylhydantoinase A